MKYYAGLKQDQNKKGWGSFLCIHMRWSPQYVQENKTKSKQKSRSREL